MKAHQLGWDPSMRLYRPLESPQFVHSYDPRVTLDSFSGNLFQTNWAIEMTGPTGQRETFITTRGISIARSEIMCGRATLVWEVVKHADLARDEPKKVSNVCLSRGNS